MTYAHQRSRTIRSVLLVDERIERLQRIERALLAAGVEVQSCARFEQAFYVSDTPADVVLVAADSAERAGWSQAETLCAGGNGAIAALAYGDGDASIAGATAAAARSAGYEPIALEWENPAALGRDLARLVVRAAPLVWILSAREYPGDRAWASAIEEAGFAVRWMRDGASEATGGRPAAVVLRDDPSTAGRGRPSDALRDLARESRLVILGCDVDPERRRSWREIGAAAYVEEPFAVEVLLAQLSPEPERRAITSPVPRESALGVLWVGLDRTGRVVEWNAAAAEFLAGPGASEALPLGELNWFDLVCAPSAREQCREQLDSLVQGDHDATTGEWPVSAYDGEVQWLHWTCRRAGSELDEGQAAFVLVGVSDGLWRRWGRADYGAAVAGADRCGDTLLLLDRQLGRVVFAGSRALSWWGVGRDALSTSTRWWDRIASSDHGSLRSAIDRARRGQAVRCGFELETDGAFTRLLQARLFLLHPDERGGAVIAVLLSEIGEGHSEPGPPVRDSISIEALLTAAPVVPFSIDARGRLTLADADLSAELGLVDDEGRELEIDVRAELPALTERLQEAFDGRGFSVPLDLDGRHVELSLWPKFDDDGEVTQVGGVAVDLSDSQRVREALRSLVDVTAPITGQAFFRELALALTRALGVRMAYLAERVDGDPERLDLISCWSAGEFSEGEIVLAEGRPERAVLTGEGVRLGRREAEERCVGFPFDQCFDASDGGDVAGYVGVPVRDAVGEVVGVLALAHDRPLDASLVDDGLLALLASRAGSELERLDSELTLERSRSRWRTLVGNMPDAVTTVTRDGTVTFSNGFYRERESVLERCAPEHRGELQRHIEAVLRTNESRSLEHRVNDERSRSLWFHTRIGALPVEKSGDDEVVLISTDITERKDQEGRDRFRGEMEKLVTEVSTRFINLEPEDFEQHLEAAVHQVGERSGADRCYLFDLVGESLAMRHAWQRAGRTPIPARISTELPDATGLGWLVPTIQAGNELLARDVDRLESSPTGVGKRVGIRSLVCVPVTSGGKVRGFLGFDTATKELDWDRAIVALLRLLTDVFANVAERQRVEEERATLSEQLRQVQKLEAIGTLAGGIAHDFNNLLTGIGGQAELLVRALGEPELRRAADTIAQTAQRGAKLTRQLLDFARRGESESVNVDVEALVGEVCDLLDRTIGKHIDVRKDLRASGAAVLGDPTQLQQVILNLAVNASDAMPENGTLTFGTSVTEVRPDEAHLFPELEPGQYVRLFVADTGCGMDADQIGRIFDPFYTTKAQGKGTGLGLALVYGIVRSHRGRVDVHSRLGEGTTFEILLPVSSAEGGCQVEDEPLEVVSGHGRLLVVDDEAVVRTTLCELAASIGYTVEGVDAGSIALDRLAARNGAGEGLYDAVLVDLRMPEMDGVELIEALRAKGDHTKAILCSGGGYERYGPRLADLDLAGFLHKPFRLAELSKVLSQVVGDRSKPAAGQLEVTPAPRSTPAAGTEPPRRDPQVEPPPRATDTPTDPTQRPGTPGLERPR
ncbi:ATP-binding protein [Rohdeia mirabilis]|uniref:ATP-binding protein n=1 Tax=Rohdeia mirabilis TaxID=2528008 RepID=UPI003AF39C07